MSFFSTTCSIKGSDAPKQAVVPQTAIAAATPTPSGGSSGGCSAGYGVLALLALLPMAYYRNK